MLHNPNPPSPLIQNSHSLQLRFPVCTKDFIHTHIHTHAISVAWQWSREGLQCCWLSKSSLLAVLVIWLLPSCSGAQIQSVQLWYELLSDSPHCSCSSEKTWLQQQAVGQVCVRQDRLDNSLPAPRRCWLFGPMRALSSYWALFLWVRIESKNNKEGMILNQVLHVFLSGKCIKKASLIWKQAADSSKDQHSNK